MFETYICTKLYNIINFKYKILYFNEWKHKYNESQDNNNI